MEKRAPEPKAAAMLYKQHIIKHKGTNIYY
jgi:hypothetical protein